MDFGAQKPSTDARSVADWIVNSRDNSGAPFIIVDKRRAAMHVFDGSAKLLGTSAVLLGFARGDESAPGIGDRPLAAVRPHERTTPAGRFSAERGRNMRGEEVLWVDYDNAVSMHRVLTTNAKERRAQRLATPTAADNRISYGCINVPAAFFDARIKPLFSVPRALVYVLPEVKPLRQVFSLDGAAGAVRVAPR